MRPNLDTDTRLDGNAAVDQRGGRSHRRWHPSDPTRAGDDDCATRSASSGALTSQPRRRARRPCARAPTTAPAGTPAAPGTTQPQRVASPATPAVPAATGQSGQPGAAAAWNRRPAAPAARLAQGRHGNRFNKPRPAREQAGSGTTALEQPGGRRDPERRAAIRRRIFLLDDCSAVHAAAEWHQPWLERSRLDSLRRRCFDAGARHRQCAIGS